MHILLFHRQQQKRVSQNHMCNVQVNKTQQITSNYDNPT